MQNANVFHAIAHPVRRQILEALAHGDLPAMAIDVDLSPSALSQQLTVLKDAELVSERREGRQRIYHLTPEPLFQPYLWLSQYEMFWKAKFNQLNSYLEDTYGKPKKKYKRRNRT